MICPKLDLDFYNYTFLTEFMDYSELPIEAKEALSFIQKLDKLKAVVYFKLKKNPKFSIRDTTRKYDVTHLQSFKAHKCFRSMKAYKVVKVMEN